MEVFVGSHTSFFQENLQGQYSPPNLTPSKIPLCYEAAYLQFNLENSMTVSLVKGAGILGSTISYVKAVGSLAIYEVITLPHWASSSAKLDLPSHSPVTDFGIPPRPPSRWDKEFVADLVCLYLLSHPFRAWSCQRRTRKLLFTSVGDSLLCPLGAFMPFGDHFGHLELLKGV